MKRLSRAAVVALRPRRFFSYVASTPRIAYVAKFQRPIVNFACRAMGTSSDEEPFMDVKVVTERVIEVVRSFEKVNADKVSASSRFKEDLDLDSLDAVEICLQLEEEFGIQIPDAEADNILSIPDAIKFIAQHPMAR